MIFFTHDAGAPAAREGGAARAKGAGARALLGGGRRHNNNETIEFFSSSWNIFSSR